MRNANQHPEWRRNMYPNTPISKPTLAHVPGVEPAGRYRTKLMKRSEGAPTAARLQKPRHLFGESAAFTGRQGIVHLGKGRVLEG